MGNNLQGDSLSRNGHYSNTVQLGTYASMDVKGEKANEDGEPVEKWKLHYFVNGISCILSSTRYLDQGGNVKRADFFFRDNICIGKVIYLAIEAETDPVRMATYIMDENPAVNELHVGTARPQTLFYGIGNMGGLIVLESRVNMVTVAHYYVTVVGNIYTQTSLDIGFSVIAKIRLSNNGNLDVTVEGPTRHPASALFYMFQEVKRTGNWKPTMCPHCANNQRERGDMSSQSESEDTDSVPPPRLHGHRRNAGNIVANDGAIRGNNNGNFIVNRLFFRRR